jgi:hypothetical protein
MDNSNTFINKINLCIILDEVCEFIKKYKFLLIFIFAIFIILILILVFFTVIKILEISVDRMAFFYDYNKLCKKKIKKYGKCEISKMYLIRNSLSKLYTFLMNLVTSFQYDKIVNQSEENFPYHTMILLEVKLNNDRIKWLLLEKNNCITINDNFILTQGMEVEEVELKKEKKIYLENFLEETRIRMGNKNFFNWHIFENNCQEFTKELMITVEKYDEYYKKKIFSNKIIESLQPSEFIYCLFNFSCIFYNFLEKYIFEIELFN